MSLVLLDWSMQGLNPERIQFSDIIKNHKLTHNHSALCVELGNLHTELAHS